jgi:hypothetical protein
LAIWLRRAGVLLAVAVGTVFLWRGLLIVVAAIAVLVAAAYVGDRWRKSRAVHRFRSTWRIHGKDLLLVYSNSPHWQRYVEENWLPKWGHRAVILNWSERSTWGRSAPAEVALFRAFAGSREFNPLAIVIPPVGRDPHVVRFWRAFRDRKHGKDGLLQAAEAELDRHLDTTVAPTRPPQPTGGPDGAN